MAFLTALCIAISVSLFITVEHLRVQVKDNFQRSVSGVDLIVGSRTSQLNLLLYSAFGLGQAADNITWQSFNHIKSDKRVNWAVPLAFGDSHQGYPVIGTTLDYFKHFKYGNKRSLTFSKGNVFNSKFELVIGSEVAKRLNYDISREIVLAHGQGNVSFKHHDNHPFIISGVLQPTGTQIDQSIYIPIQSINTIHAQVQSTDTHEHEHEHEHERLTSIEGDEKINISAFLLGVNNKISVLTLQRSINQFTAEPLTAILPGLALRELWKIVSVIENVLTLISILVLVTALICMVIMLMASMQQREREVTVLRALGAKPLIIVWLLEVEVVVLTLVGTLFGGLFVSLVLLIVEPILVAHYGLYVNPLIDFYSLIRVGLMALIAAICLALIPAVLAYKKSLNSGLKL
ncbi:ABC transporter permease [Paraglaciecola sp.]|uniref:ABC transporter permease n=1 Tax=Paraglaciecola sp. TaxID=1920173 RepID=UPI003EF9D4B9